MGTAPAVQVSPAEGDGCSSFIIFASFKPIDPKSLSNEKNNCPPLASAGDVVPSLTNAPDFLVV
jgi:hypothetical protein